MEVVNICSDKHRHAQRKVQIILGLSQITLCKDNPFFCHGLKLFPVEIERMMLLAVFAFNLYRNNLAGIPNQKVHLILCFSAARESNMPVSSM